ncbi:MAG: hypothetical protein WDL87_01905 [Candidatus Omnitrophota bacterium]|jgi:hypothetical protein
MRAIAFETITVDDSVKTLTLANYDPETIKSPGGVSAAPAAYITSEGGDMRYRLDGVDPTISEGHLLKSGDDLKFKFLAQLKNFKIIRTGGTSGVLQISYFDGEDL